MALDINAWLRAIAGTVVLASVGLSVVHDPRWLWLTAFVGLNLLQSSVSGWCPMMAVLRKAGVREGRC
ncbi:MAG: DUF2892 domain-containing protein [Nitrospirota bacterium]